MKGSGLVRARLNDANRDLAVRLIIMTSSVLWDAAEELGAHPSAPTSGWPPGAARRVPLVEAGARLAARPHPRDAYARPLSQPCQHPRSNNASQAGARTFWKDLDVMVSRGGLVGAWDPADIGVVADVVVVAGVGDGCFAASV